MSNIKNESIVRYNGGYVDCGWSLTKGKFYEVKLYSELEHFYGFGDLTTDMYILDDKGHMLSVLENEFDSFDVVNMTELTYKYFDKLNSLINEEEIDDMATVTQEHKDSLQEKIDALQRELDSLKVEKEWCDTQDTLILRNETERIEVECNYSTWNATKHQANEPTKDNVLLIDVYEGEDDYSSSACTAINLEQMIQLRDYLTHKIEYLQS